MPESAEPDWTETFETGSDLESALFDAMLGEEDFQPETSLSEDGLRADLEQALSRLSVLANQYDLGPVHVATTTELLDRLDAMDMNTNAVLRVLLALRGPIAWLTFDNSSYSEERMNSHVNAVNLSSPLLLVDYSRWERKGYERARGVRRENEQGVEDSFLQLVRSGNPGAPVNLNLSFSGSSARALRGLDKLEEKMRKEFQRAMAVSVARQATRLDLDFVLHDFIRVGEAREAPFRDLPFDEIFNFIRGLRMGESSGVDFNLPRVCAPQLAPEKGIKGLEPVAVLVHTANLGERDQKEPSDWAEPVARLFNITTVQVHESLRELIKPGRGLPTFEKGKREHDPLKDGSSLKKNSRVK